MREVRGVVNIQVENALLTLVVTQTGPVREDGNIPLNSEVECRVSLPDALTILEEAKKQVKAMMGG